MRTRNVTLRMDDDLLRRLRHRAVDAGVSLSAWITSTLKSAVGKDVVVERARNRALRRMERGFHLGGRPLDRDGIHAR